jgi:hypothetical protein
MEMLSLIPVDSVEAHGRGEQQYGRQQPSVWRSK